MTQPVSRPLLAVAEGSFAQIDDLRDQFDEHAEIRVGSVQTPDDVSALTEGADALIVTLHPIRAAHIAALPDSVRVIVRAGVGLDTVDVEAARDRGIVVAYQPAYATSEVADHAAALALAAWRRVCSAHAALRRTGWATAAEIGRIDALATATLGVLGAGRIGRALIARLRPFVGRVVAFDALPDPGLDGVEWMATPDEVLESSDLISLHLPLTPETRHIIDAERIARMRRHAIIVNVSRGGLIDERALAEALHAGRLGGAALDVFEEEPLSADSPLFDAPHAILTPHLAWYSEGSRRRLAEWSILDAVSYSSQTELLHGSIA